MTRRLDYAVFDDDDALRAAALECRAADLRVVDAWLPYPVHGMDKLLDIRPTRLPWVTFAAGVAGVGLALWFEYWTSATDWPLDVGGKPYDSLPAFVPIAFEMLVLLGGLATAAGLCVRSRLWPGRRRRVLDPRLTDDRFALLVERRDARVTDDQVAAIWSRHGAAATWTETEGS